MSCPCLYDLRTFWYITFSWIFTTIYAISVYHHLSCELESRSWWSVLDTTLCDKICQWLEADRWFSLSTPVSSSNKTDPLFIHVWHRYHRCCQDLLFKYTYLFILIYTRIYSRSSSPLIPPSFLQWKNCIIFILQNWTESESSNLKEKE
jgi:hypothetical protein